LCPFISSKQNKYKVNIDAYFETYILYALPIVFTLIKVILILYASHSYT